MILACPGSVGAFCHALTHTLDAIADPTVPTATLEAAGNIDAGGVHVAVVSPDLALVHVWTNAKMSHFRDSKRSYLALNRASSCMHVSASTVTHARAAHSLVSVCTCAARGALIYKIAQLTVADEGAFGVLAVAMETDVWVQVTLVHIWVDRLMREHSS